MKYVFLCLQPIQMENPYFKEKRQCILCKWNIEPDYKNVRLLSQFQSRYTGRIYEKHITGLCEYKHKRVIEEIMKAQNAGVYSIVIMFIVILCLIKGSGRYLLSNNCIKFSIFTGLMGYVTKEPTYAKDPSLFDPNHPFKPHQF